MFVSCLQLSTPAGGCIVDAARIKVQPTSSVTSLSNSLSGLLRAKSHIRAPAGKTNDDFALDHLDNPSRSPIELRFLSVKSVRDPFFSSLSIVH